jgi:hypothetical protein
MICWSYVNCVQFIEELPNHGVCFTYIVHQVLTMTLFKRRQENEAQSCRIKAEATRLEDTGA